VIEPDARVDARDEGGAVLVAVTGAIDLSTAPGVEAEIMAAISNAATAVTLDLAGVDYLDSSGLRVVFRLTSRLAELRTPMVVVAPPGSISRRLIELSGYTEVGTLRP
jgi:anti-anti-sigma factor